MPSGGFHLKELLVPISEGMALWLPYLLFWCVCWGRGWGGLLFVFFVFPESAPWPSDLKRILNCQFNLPKTGGAWKPSLHWHTTNLIQIDFGFKSRQVKKLLWIFPKHKGPCFAILQSLWLSFLGPSLWNPIHEPHSWGCYPHFLKHFSSKCQGSKEIELHTVVPLSCPEYQFGSITEPEIWSLTDSITIHYCSASYMLGCEPLSRVTCD